MLRATVERHAARPALAFGESELAYADLSAHVDRLTDRLVGLARPGERVAIVAPNVPALVVALFAVWRTGAVAVPLNARLRDYELRGVFADAEPAAVVAVEAHQGYSFGELLSTLMPELPMVRGSLLVDEAGEVRHELTGARRARRAADLPRGVTTILYTSGTTGAPKGALVTRDCALAGAHALADRLALGPEDAAVLVVPATHAFGLGCLLATLVSGGTALLVESGFSLDPLLGAVQQGATVLHGPPALFARLLAAVPDGIPAIRGGFVAGAPCPPAVLERLDAIGMSVLNVFGMTEIGAATACSADDPPELRRTTVGRPLPGYEFRAVGGGQGEPGELQVRGPYVTPGYLGKPEETAAAFDGEWFRTGDLGTIDEAGYVRIAGRAKEVVNVGGFNVFPAEVEGFLLTNPDVAQAVVLGVPDERMGEALAAFVVPRPGARVEPAELLRFARPHIAGYKLPYRIEVVSELPMLASGKPDRAALEKTLGQEPAAAGAARG